MRGYYAAFVFSGRTTSLQPPASSLGILGFLVCRAQFTMLPEVTNRMQTHYPNAYVLNVVAKDRPGIVAAIAKAVVDYKGTIDTCSQTVVAEFFTLIMVVSFPQPVPEEKFSRAIADPTDHKTGVHVHLRPYEPGAMTGPAAAEGENFVITAFGADQAGVVLRFSRYLSDRGININDLYGTVADGQFILIGQVRVPNRWDIRMLQADLEQLAGEIGHTVRLQHENVFFATNQLRLPHVRPVRGL
jgi:glycine cleavage system transcriptional repressor